MDAGRGGRCARAAGEDCAAARAARVSAGEVRGHAHSPVSSAAAASGPPARPKQGCLRCIRWLGLRPAQRRASGAIDGRVGSSTRKGTGRSRRPQRSIDHRRVGSSTRNLEALLLPAPPFSPSVTSAVISPILSLEHLGEMAVRGAKTPRRQNPKGPRGAHRRARREAACSRTPIGLRVGLDGSTATGPGPAGGPAAKRDGTNEFSRSV